MPTDLPEQGLVVLGLEHGEHPEQAAHHHRCGHRRHPALELDHEVVQAGLGRAIAEGARRVERASQLTGAQGEYGFADTDLPEGEELSLNLSSCFFNGLQTTRNLVNVAWRILNLLRRSPSLGAGARPARRSSIRTSSRAATPTSWCAAIPPPEQVRVLLTRTLPWCVRISERAAIIALTRPLALLLRNVTGDRLRLRSAASCAGC